MKTVFVVGRIYRGVKGEQQWDLQGVYDKEKNAVDACPNPSYFVGPVEMNKRLAHETIKWPDIYYPVAPAEQG